MTWVKGDKLWKEENKGRNKDEGKGNNGKDLDER